MIEDWSSLAACRHGGADSLFGPSTEQNLAKRICRGCPVRMECLADALDNRIEWGVWGGMTERERRGLLRRHPSVPSWRGLFEQALEAKHSAAPIATATRDPSAEFAAIRESMATSEFAACYEAEHLLLVRFLIRLGAPEQDAFDAAQDAFVEAYRCWEQIHSPRAWLRKVATRRLTRWPEIPLGERSHVTDPGPNGIQIAEETRDVLAALRRLPMMQRIAMAWTLDGFKPTEIANELDTTAEAVRQALTRARRTLKRILLPGGGQQA